MQNRLCLQPQEEVSLTVLHPPREPSVRAPHSDGLCAIVHTVTGGAPRAPAPRKLFVAGTGKKKQIVNNEDLDGGQI